MPKCKECGKSVKDASKSMACPQCGKFLCDKCYSKHKCK